MRLITTAIATRLVAGAILVATTLWLLNAFAQYRVAEWLSASAAEALVLAANGQTPYQWNLRDKQDIVAGRVFGAADFSFSDHGLTVRSNGVPFEIGLPLAHAVDLQRFPLLRIEAENEAPVSIVAVVRSQLDAPQRFSSTTIQAAGKRVVEIELSRTSWTDDRASVPAPDRAAMLRLRVQMARGQLFHLHTVALERIHGFQLLSLASTPRIVDAGSPVANNTIAVYRIPQPASESVIHAVAKRVDVHSALLLDLPDRGRVEQQLLLRDRILEAAPAAILVAQDALSATFAQARAQVDSAHTPLTKLPWKWIGLGVYMVLLIATRVWPCARTRLRALIEVILALLGPLWLIVGENFTGTDDTWQHLLIAASVVYALSLYRPGIWQFNGSAKAWLCAGAVVVVAAAVGMAMHGAGTGLRPINAAHVLRYLAWALMQQYLVCAICTQRWHIVSGSSTIAVYLGALGFALLHAPNPTLMLATFCAGMCWCALYLRERALLPLAASHAAGALLLVALLPPEILRSAEVSVRFFS